MWAEVQQAQGHELERGDLLRQYCLFLDSETAFLVDKQKSDQPLTEWEQKALPHFQKRQKALKKKDPRAKTAIFLLGKTGLVERSKQRVTGLSSEEEKVLMEQGWRFWDYLLGILSQKDCKQLSAFVAQPERWILNRIQIVISMSDQIPVWLKADSKKVLLSKRKLDEAAADRQSRKRRKVLVEEARQGKATEQDASAGQQGRTTAVASGNPANSRCRYTLVARQLIHHFFDPDRAPTGGSGNYIEE